MLPAPATRRFRRNNSWMSRLFLVALLAAAVCPGQSPELTPTGFINDFADVLSPRAKRALETFSTELKQKTGAEVAVAIVPSLGDETIETYTNLLAEQWGVGDEEDRGVLILLAIQDRQLRVEVGYGLEPIIPDGRAGEIRDRMTPLLRAGNYDAAVTVAVAQVGRIVAQDAGVSLTGQVQAPRSGRGRRRTGTGWWPLMLVFLLLMLPRRRRYGGWHGGGITTAWMLGSMGGFGGGLGGGGFRGGGGFSSGGFGGFGGGGFGGGGASGSW